MRSLLAGNKCGIALCVANQLSSFQKATHSFLQKVPRSKRYSRQKSLFVCLFVWFVCLKLVCLFVCLFDLFELVVVVVVVCCCCCCCLLLPSFRSRSVLGLCQKVTSLWTRTNPSTRAKPFSLAGYHGPYGHRNCGNNRGEVRKCLLRWHRCRPRSEVP